MTKSSKTSAKVAILLCTYQGEKFLPRQLDSLMTQTYSNWTLSVSDDGSKDRTIGILENYQQEWRNGRLTIYHGPKQGFCSNFLSLTCKSNINADYYAYSDQDDVWDADKLQRAVDLLDKVPSTVPALYCSRTLAVDNDDQPLAMSPLFQKTPSFANALVQCIAGGNTMLFNNAARQLMLTAGEHVNVVTHDWWVYLLVSGSGGRVFYDPVPTIRYRQHGGNLVGMNDSWTNRLLRIHKLLQGHYKDWNERHIQALNSIREILTPENQVILDLFSATRQKSLLPRLNGLIQCGVYRQTFLGNMGLIVAAIFRKI